MTNSTSKVKYRAFLLEFIHLYRDLPELWNVKSKEYYDREKKKNSYKLLTIKYREMYPTATRDDVKKKLNSIRTNYRKEVKKYLQSLQFGEEYIYKPVLWYYNEMRFLQNVEMPYESQSSTIDTEKEKSENISENENSSRSTDNTSPPLCLSRGKTKIAKIKSQNEKLNLTSKAKWSTMETEFQHTDNYQYWGLACAEDLQKMDPTQQIYAKKAIAEILMEGSLGLLHRHSVKINDPSSQQSDPLSISTPQNKVP